MWRQRLVCFKSIQADAMWLLCYRRPALLEQVNQVESTRSAGHIEPHRDGTNGSTCTQALNSKWTGSLYKSQNGHLGLSELDGVWQSGCEVTGFLLEVASPRAGEPGRINTHSWFHWGRGCTDKNRDNTEGHTVNKNRALVVVCSVVLCSALPNHIHLHWLFESPTFTFFRSSTLHVWTYNQ